MQGLLRVTPEKLISASSEFASTASQMNSMTSEMMSLVQSLRSVWQGEASTSYSNRFSSLQSDMDKLYRMVTEHSKDLNEMAEGYMQAEKANADKGNSMKANVVV